MRVLVISALYPPVAYGGYEVECSGVVERLRERHEVLVLTSAQDRRRAPAEAGVRRELTRLPADRWGALRAPWASLSAAASARRALAFEPDLVYVWNGSNIPQAALRLLADSGVPLAFRVCEHWFAQLFSSDQFLRELVPGGRHPAWAPVCRAVNRLPGLRLAPYAPLRAAISWNSQAIREMAATPGFVEPVLERVEHSVPRFGDLYAQVVREPQPQSGPTLLFVGRVTQYKGVSVALEALALARSQHGLAARLSVLGPEDAGYGEEMRRLAERLGVAEAVSWGGPRTPAEVAQAFAGASALIVPSLWREPFPLVTIEGALARVPLIATDIGGIGEGMHDEEHALLFAPADAAAAAAAFARILAEPEQTAARVQRARERAEAFRLGPYLDRQELFVTDALAALGGRARLSSAAAALGAERA